jgi:hypothetical protein
MIKSLALVWFLASTLAITAAYGSAFLPQGSPDWAPWLLSLGTAGVLVSAMTIGAVRNGRLGRLVYPFALFFVVLFGGLAAVLLLPPADPADLTLWFGLPPRAAVLLYGVGLLPLLIVPVVYALTFDEMTLGADDWERIRKAASESQAHLSELQGLSGAGRGGDPESRDDAQGSEGSAE